MKALHARGLTLLEMMVVLLIAGMALTLGFQSLTQWQKAEQALSGASRQTREALLTEAWWSESVRGITAQADIPLEGDHLRFHAASTAPVLADPGVATPIDWQLVKDGPQWRLRLSEHTRTVDLPLVDVTDCSFSYLDESGKTHATWPPRLGEQAPVPAAIVLLQKTTSGRELAWLMAISGPAKPFFQPFEWEPE